MQFIFTAEGYYNVVSFPTSGDIVGAYVYNYTDHLGNIRLSYTLDQATQEITPLEEHHYYPFGLEHKYYNSTRKTYEKQEEEVTLADGSKIAIVRPVVVQVPNSGYQYQYNGKEFQDELGLNMTAMDFRQYDNALGRFVGMDRLSELIQFQSPYSFSYNNPNYWCDPSGLIGEDIKDYYYDKKGNVIYDPNVHGPNDVPDGATYIGPTYTDPDTGTFWDENGVPHSTTQNLNEVVINSTNKNSSNIILWINTSLGFSSLYYAYKSEYITKSEFWHFDKKGNLHTIIDKDWNKAKNVRKYQTIKLELPRNISNALAGASILMTAVNINKTGELKASDVLYTTMAGISFTGVGSVVAGVFFMADLATMGYTYIRDGESKSIGDILDQNTNGGVLLNKNDFK